MLAVCFYKCLTTLAGVVGAKRMLRPIYHGSVGLQLSWIKGQYENFLSKIISQNKQVMFCDTSNGLPAKLSERHLQIWVDTLIG